MTTTIPIGTDMKNSNKEYREFPYRLSYPAQISGLHLSATSYTIALAYHVGILTSNKSIVTDPMEALDQCGLGKTASDFIPSDSGGELEDVLNLTRPGVQSLCHGKKSSPSTTIVHSTKNLDTNSWLHVFTMSDFSKNNT